MSGVTYALTTVVLQRSYSRYSGSTSERRARRASPAARRRSATRCSCAGFAYECSRQTATMSGAASRERRGQHDRPRRRRPATSTRPSASSRSATPKVRPGSTIGRGRRHEDVVELRPRLPADADDVFEPFGRDERDARALALEHRVGRDGRSMDDVVICLVLGESSRRPSRMARDGSSGVDRSLCTTRPRRSETDEIGERAAGIDAEPK